MSAEPLQWEECESLFVDGHSRWSAKANPGVYWVYSASQSDTVWMCWLMTDDALGEPIYRGDSPDKAKAEAVKHHLSRSAAAARRLAWERYMAENDPPSNGEAL
ncbi:Uncharacterised protein [Mycobacteroides abscessus subsp. massiliense]|nr:Uncharacterised protein [Mycobacteroides abscessus subsp. massiliense]SKY71929.1 Uncharacterised protein [Mycobacteroides abscessus subsp. massiliense]